MGGKENGGNLKEHPGTEVEVVWECDEKRGALRMNEGDGNESTRWRRGRLKRRWLDKVKDDIKEKGLSGEEVEL